MSTRYSYEDIAMDFGLWGQYVDPFSVMTEDEFNAMTIEQKIALLQKLFGPEDQDVQEEDF